MTIILPIAISLMAGGVDLGWWVSTQATGSKSVRDAARYLASLPVSIDVCHNAYAQANAQSLAVYGKFGGTDGIDTPLISGWQMNGGVTITTSSCSTSCPAPWAGVSVCVTAQFPYTSMIVASFIPIAGQYTLSAQHVEVQIGS